MSLSYEKLWKFTERNIKRAFGNIELLQVTEASAIEFPGYKRMKPCDYRETFFATLFLDIRKSTERAFEIGPQNTFVTIQALFPTLARIVGELDGFVVDYPGDGIMAHWELDHNRDQVAIRNCVQAAAWMMESVEEIVNPLLIQYQIKSLMCGIGISAGHVIVTKVGNSDFMSAKAIGHSINRAAKLCHNPPNEGCILIDKTISDFAYNDISKNHTMFPFQQSTNPAFTYRDLPEEAAEIIRPNMPLPRDTNEAALSQLRASLGLE